MTSGTLPFISTLFFLAYFFLPSSEKSREITVMMLFVTIVTWLIYFEVFE